MNIVIDANIIFAALIKEGYTSYILFNNNLDLFVPEFVMSEFEKHKEQILEKSKRSSLEVFKLLDILKERITLIPDEELINFVQEAEEITPDPNDMTYFALALKLSCPIWTNDKKLKQQDKVKIYHTHELADLIK